MSLSPWESMPVFTARKTLTILVQIERKKERKKKEKKTDPKLYSWLAVKAQEKRRWAKHWWNLHRNTHWKCKYRNLIHLFSFVSDGENCRQSDLFVVTVRGGRRTTSH